jgi:hypothetical protein
VIVTELTSSGRCQVDREAATGGHPRPRSCAALPRITYEDLTLGRKLDLDTVETSRDEMVEYARGFDLRPCHLKGEAVRNTVTATLPPRAGTPCRPGCAPSLGRCRQ